MKGGAEADVAGNCETSIKGCARRRPRS